MTMPANNHQPRRGMQYRLILRKPGGTMEVLDFKAMAEVEGWLFLHAGGWHEATVHDHIGWRIAAWVRNWGPDSVHKPWHRRELGG